MGTLTPVEQTFVGFEFQRGIGSRNVEAAIVGIPYVSPYPEKSFYHSKNAADRIRQESKRYGAIDHYDFDFDSDLLAGGAISCVDCGNLIHTSGNFEKYTKDIADTIRLILEGGAVPIVIGGDHGITIPVLHAYKAYQQLCVVQIDAHLDWVDERGGVRNGFSSPMRRASELSYVSSVVQIGLRGQGSARQQEVEDARACSKSMLIKAEELHNVGVIGILNRIPSAPFYYLTIDADGLDPSIAPGVAYPTPGGVSYYQVLNIMRGLASKGKLVGMDYVEVVPELDVANFTSLFAARIILNYLGVLARSIQAHS